MFETRKEGQFVEPCFENFNLIIFFLNFGQTTEIQYLPPANKVLGR